MAAQEVNNSPNFYGERLQDDSVAHAFGLSDPDSSAVLRLPIQQPKEAHFTNNPEAMPMPTSTSFSSPAGPPDGIRSKVGPPNPKQTPKRVSGEVNRFSSYPMIEREDEPDIRRQSRRRPYEPFYYQDYRAAYVEDDYYDDEERPRAYRRPNRRYSTRPPLSHQNFHNRDRDRYERDHARRSSESGYATLEYEPDTPTKPHVFYDYGSDEDDGRRGRPHPYPGGGGRGPPRRPPSTEEVLRLPWTMWMNSNAKNRRSPRKPNRAAHAFPGLLVKTIEVVTDPPSIV